MLATITSGAVLGVDAFLIAVEVAPERGIPAILVTGMPEAAIRESRDRVHAALANSGYYLPPRRVTVNISPADVPKQASVLDLPLAVAMLAAAGQIRRTDRLSRYMVLGELAMDGTLRPVRGALPLALAAKKSGFAGIVLPELNALEAAAVANLDVRGAATLTDAVRFLEEAVELPLSAANPATLAGACDALDFADVKGHESVKRALESPPPERTTS